MAIGATNQASAQTAGHAPVTFMVFSDPHVMDTTLFTADAPVFQSYCNGEPKLVEYSAELFDTAVARVLAAHPDILLIPGDLTKDGELASHQYVVSKLTMLQNAGIDVYVVPGNHDLANPAAYAYHGNTRTQVANISEADFATMYGPWGYNNAVLRMPNDLSYMAYPAPGLALICLNSCLPNTTSRASGGGLNEAHLVWAEQAAARAHADGRAIIGMMHHPVVNHFTEEARFASTYVSNSHASLNNGVTEGDDNYFPVLDTLQQRLIRAGFRAIITGHFHIQSIQQNYLPSLIQVAPYDTHTRLVPEHLTDISTGALCAYASPLRTMVFADSILTVTSDTIGIYQAVAAARNANTVRGAINQLAPLGYDKLMGKIPSLIDDSTVIAQMNIPQSPAEFAADLTRYFMVPGLDIFNSLSRGDEDFNSPTWLYLNFKDSCESYMRYVINGAKYELNLGFMKIDLFERTLKPMFYQMLNPYVESVLYNWVDLDDRTEMDGEPAFGGHGFGYYYVGDHYVPDWSAQVPLYLPANYGVATGHEVLATDNDAAAPVKIFHNGQILIIRGTDTYNILGTKIQ